MIYVDASVLMAALTSEVDTARAQGLLHAIANEIAVSPWTSIEVASALSMKVRARTLSADQGSETWLVYERDILQGAHILPVGDREFASAQRLARQPSLKLRGGDALHVAIALYGRTALSTLDKDMRAAALALGLEVVDP